MATPARSADNAGKVMSGTLPELRPELQPAAERLYVALMRQAHYLLGTVHQWGDDASRKLLTDSKSAEHWIRPNTSTLVGLAVLQRWGPYDANVVGVPDERFGETVVLVCSVSAPTTEEEIISAIKSSIADYKAPRRVVFVPEVYRAPNGKADYRWARDQAAAAS